MSKKKVKSKPEAKRVRKVVGLSEYHYTQLGVLAKKAKTSLQGYHAEVVEKALIARGCKPSPPKPPRKNAAKPKPPKKAKPLVTKSAVIAGKKVKVSDPKKTKSTASKISSKSAAVPN